MKNIILEIVSGLVMFLLFSFPIICWLFGIGCTTLM